MKTKSTKKAAATAASLAPLHRCGAEVLLGYVATIADAGPGVHQGDDPESVHRMRVALRRLRSVLPCFHTGLSRPTCARWRKHLRQLAKTLGAARDLDVQLAYVTQFLSQQTTWQERPGVERVRLRLQQRRQALQEPVRQALARLEEKDLLTEMRQTLHQLAEAQHAYTDMHPGRPVYRKTRRAIRQALRALTDYDRDLASPDATATLHAMRLAVKQLRYTMQALRPLYAQTLDESIEAAQTLQTLLGTFHDCDVWAQNAAQWLTEERACTLAYFGYIDPMIPLEPGILALQQDCAQRRPQAYQACVDFWQHTQQQGLWERLRQTLRATRTSPMQDAEPPAQGTAEEHTSAHY